MKKITKLFEFPVKLGILQEVEFSYNEYHRQYEGVLTAAGCRRGICIKYRVAVRSRNGSEWDAVKPRRRESDLGGCIRQPVADALWELAGKYDVGLWYEYSRPCKSRHSPFCVSPNSQMEDCGLMINGIKLRPPYYCRTVEDCVEQILEDYKREVEKLKEPPMKTSNAEEFLRQYPELEVFGVEWIESWLIYARERMVKIAEILKNHQKVKELIKRVGIRENPYLIEIYITADEACMAIGIDVYCLSTDKVRKVSLDYIGQVSPRGLMAFAKRKEFTRVV
jgi:hypothetical protein